MLTNLFRLDREASHKLPSYLPKKGLCLLLLLFILGAVCSLSLAQEKDHAPARKALNLALQAIEKQTLSGDRSALQRRTAIISSDLAPKTAARLCDGITGVADTIRARGAVGVALAQVDPKQSQSLFLSAAALLRDISNDYQRDTELAYLCLQYAQLDPTQAIIIAREIKNPQILEFAWNQIAHIAPHAALEDLETNPPPLEIRRRRLAVLLPDIAREDLEGALALTEELTDPLLKSQALAQISFSLEAEDAVAVASRIPDSFLHTLALRAAVERLAATDPAAALRAVDFISGDRDSALAAIAHAAYAVDPQQAVALLDMVASPRVRADTLGLLVIDLAENDAPAAVQLAVSHPALPSWALPALYAAMAQIDPDAAVARANEIPHSHIRDLALCEIARILAADSPQAAADLLAQVSDPSLRFDVLRVVVATLAASDPEQAQSLVGLASDTKEVHLLLLEIARAAAPQNLALAVKLAKSAAPSPAKTETLLELAEIAANSDLTGGLAILQDELPEYAAGQTLAARLAQTAPDTAIESAHKIVNPLYRAHAFCDIAEIRLDGAPARNLSRAEVQRVVETGGPFQGEAGSENSFIEIIDRQPEALSIRLQEVLEGLYTVRYQGPHASYTWENISPAETIVLRDDGHLLPEQRLRCASRGTESDPTIFDDSSKAHFEGNRRLAYGVPVSSFGGAGYLSSAPTWVHRDAHRNFWIYQDQRPWRIASFDTDFNYRFSIVFPSRILALDSDAEANLYVLQERNLLSRFDTNGRPLAHWQLNEGRKRGEFVHATGLAVDPYRKFIYLADSVLGRVQRFDSQMRLKPFHFVPWGWLGREDLSYLRLGKYEPESKYRLDRPHRLLLTPDDLLYVDCAYYLMRFDVTTGRQVEFGRHDVLGWGGTFEDSPFSKSAATNGHWQEHSLAGIDPQGRIYISDTENMQLKYPRLQIFSPQGNFLAKLDSEAGLIAADGRRVYPLPPMALAFGPARLNKDSTVWITDGGCRIYESTGLRGGGRLHLGPGAPGRQFDLTLVNPEYFSIERQTGYFARKAEGEIVTFSSSRRETTNCENERKVEIPNGQSSVWLPVRLGEPFKVSVFEGERKIPEFEYTVEVESQPSPFGTQWDFLRITNKSGYLWRNFRYVADTAGVAE